MSLISLSKKSQPDNWRFKKANSDNINRSQISQGAEIMGQVVPIVIHPMMNDYQRVWCDACYPMVD
jgi:hypothetical protein